MKIFQNLQSIAQNVAHEEKTSLPPETTPRGERNQVIDLMKGLLIIGMVLSHVHSGLNLSVPWLDPRRGIPQLTIFSGLFFAFGYGTYKAYLEKTTIPYRRLVLNIIRILLAYYLCVIAYEFFNDHVLSLKSLLSIVQLDFLVPYTEFLLAYVIILILVLIIPRIFNTVARKDILFWPVMGGLLIASLFDYTQNTSVWLSLVIGSETITSYPVVQYLPLYLMGIYFAQRQIRFSWKFLAGAILAIAGFLVFRGNGQVSRYPPSFFWIVGSMGAVYVCYLISHLIFFITPLQKPLVDIGRHALYWMVMSDLFIFSISIVLKNIPLPSYWVAGIIIGIFFCIAYLSFLARK